MVETLWTNHDMIGNPRYGRIGVYALPFFVFGEMLGPLIEGLGYLIIPLAVYFGAINWPFFALFFYRDHGLWRVPLVVRAVQ